MLTLFRRIIRKISRDFGIDLLVKKDFIPSSNYFSNIYEKQLFGEPESASGTGSTHEATKSIRNELPLILKKYSITSIADVPCGDLNWMSLLDFKKYDYSGFDIVPDLISQLKINYPLSDFKVFDATREILPKFDLIICRDLLVHLSLNQSLDVIENFRKSGSKYLLATTFTDRKSNEELVFRRWEVGWRPLNLELKPFDLGSPIFAVNENSTEGDNQYGDKSLGFWLLN
jgi:hypothetical protein